MAERKRYAAVGLGSRSRMFTTALLKDYADRGQLVAFCDQNQTRMDYYNEYYAETFGAAPVPTYKPQDFERMLEEQRVDCVIVLNGRTAVRPRATAGFRVRWKPSLAPSGPQTSSDVRNSVTPR